MEEYVCTVCGYIYKPSEGDKEENIKAGTDFKDIPTDWICPICGAEKAVFEKV